MAKGSPLFVIDPRMFQAAVNAAKARLREAEANASLAQAEHGRAEQLYAKKVVARDRLDTAIASLNAGRAQVEAARAALDTAQLDLSYTRVTAPISGRIDRALVTEGNYVTRGETPLTTIVSIDPLHVYFDVDERTYLHSLAATRAARRDQGRERRQGHGGDAQRYDLCTGRARGLSGQLGRPQDRHGARACGGGERMGA